MKAILIEIDIFFVHRTCQEPLSQALPSLISYRLNATVSIPVTVYVLRLAVYFPEICTANSPNPQFHWHFLVVCIVHEGCFQLVVQVWPRTNKAALLAFPLLFAVPSLICRSLPLFAIHKKECPHTRAITVEC